MKQAEIVKAISTMTILVDTREQRTELAEERYKQFGYPYKRYKLSFGDYSAVCRLPDGEELNLSGTVAVERKMSIDELCQCLGRDRSRFKREFDRAKAAGAKIYLLVEDASWRKIYRHQYRSLLTVPALVGSILTFLKQYDIIPIFCDSGYSGQLIADLMKYELKEALKSYGQEDRESAT